MLLAEFPVVASTVAALAAQRREQIAQLCQV
jgi:hypothetical protein